MSYRYVVDSSIWVEYFRGSEKGGKIKELIEGESVATSIFSIAELADKFEREGWVITKHMKFIEEHIAILPLTTSCALLAGKLKNNIRRKKSKFGLGDAIHLATSLQEGSILLTADTDFAGCERVRII